MGWDERKEEKRRGEEGEGNIDLRCSIAEPTSSESIVRSHSQ